MKKLPLNILITSFLSLVFISGCAHCPQQKDTLYQVSTIDALLNASYDGDKDVESLKAHGDFGIGTFNNLDGEMLLLDGVFHQIKSDGKVYEVSPGTKTPFACVTFFDAKDTFILESGTNSAKFAKDSPMYFLPNYVYAVKIGGTFKMIKARSVPAQTKPYPLLAEVVKTQPVFEFRDVKGTLAGFFTPYFLKGVNVPGIHMHFISDDRRHGGHVLDFEITEGFLKTDKTTNIFLALPDSPEFSAMDFRNDMEKDLNKVEK
ncbi:MAG: acetolactate decarboxylase [Victivallales bacterium]